MHISEVPPDGESPRCGFFGTLLKQLEQLFCCGTIDQTDQRDDLTIVAVEENIGGEIEQNHRYGFDNERLTNSIVRKSVIQVKPELHNYFSAQCVTDGRKGENAEFRNENQNFSKVIVTEGTDIIRTPLKELQVVTRDFSARDFYVISGEQHREQAREHLSERKRLLELAHKYNKTNKRLAVRYFEEANKQLTLSQEANNQAAAAFLEENSKRNPAPNTIDLHYLFVKEAIQALDSFLDDEISDLRWGDLQNACLMVITGRGKHSADGIPKIKFAVQRRLKKRSLQYFEANPGLLKVNINRSSLLTRELN